MSPFLFQVRTMFCKLPAWESSSDIEINSIMTVNYKAEYTGWPKKKTEQSMQSIFRILLWSTVIFFTLLDRASSPHYNTMITPRSSNVVENFFILWVISYGLSFSGFARFPEFRDTINDSFSSTCANTYQHSTSYKEISGPMTCLDCKSLLGNTRITKHNTRSIYGRPKLSLTVPRNSRNRANPENDSP